MTPRPLVFVHARPFADGDTGVVQRVRLVLEALSTTGGDRLRYLLSPDDVEARALAVKLGWTFLPMTAWDARQPLPVRAAIRWFYLAAARVSPRARRELVKKLGGSGLVARPLVSLLDRLPPADVWLSHSDSVHLAADIPPSSRMVLDAMDSVWNMMRRYEPRRRLRQLSGRSLAGVLADMREAELALAGRCTRIIAISPEDRDYFRHSACRDVVLEESCVATPEVLAPEPPCDVGFLGGRHSGSLASARNFLRLAARPELEHLRFALAGAVCEALSPAEQNGGRVELRGRVKSAAGFFTACKQVVFWSEGETGTSVKFQEAILSGTTVLANAAAARWSRAVPGRDYIRCASWENLVGHVRQGTRLAPSPLREECAPALLRARFKALLAADVSVPEMHSESRS